MRGENRDIWEYAGPVFPQSCSRVLTSRTCQNGYSGCGEGQRYLCGRCAMLKLPFVAPKLRLYRIQKKGKKGQKRAKNEKLFCKNNYFFLRVHKLDIVLGVNMDRKNRVGKVCSPKKIFDFLSPVKVRNFGNFLIFIAKYLAIHRRNFCQVPKSCG